MLSLRPHLDRLSADLRPGVPVPPRGVILTDEEAAEHQAWYTSLTDTERASRRVIAIDFRPAPGDR